jgi:hypothetical protein
LRIGTDPRRRLGGDGGAVDQDGRRRRTAEQPVGAEHGVDQVLGRADHREDDLASGEVGG